MLKKKKTKKMSSRRNFTQLGKLMSVIFIKKKLKKIVLTITLT